MLLATLNIQRIQTDIHENIPLIQKKETQFLEIPFSWQDSADLPRN
jgi:hypothetical protein